MKLNKQILDEAKKILGQKKSKTTIEITLRNLINNRKAIELFRKTSGKSKWKGFNSDESEET